MKKLWILVCILCCAVHMTQLYALFGSCKKRAPKAIKHDDLAINMDVPLDELPEEFSLDQNIERQDAQALAQLADEEDVTEKEMHETPRQEKRIKQSVSDGSERIRITSETSRSISGQEFDPRAKEKQILHLIEKAENYLKNHTVDEALTAFDSREFREGGLYLFVYDIQGTCLMHGQHKDLIWQNLYDLKDTYGNPFVQTMIEKAKAGGGWVTYEWRNSTKKSYAKGVRKGDTTYVIGTGYYPHSKEDIAIALVKGAVGLFNEVAKSKRPIDEAFSPIGYPLGRFVVGDLYLYVLDFNGIQYAHGELPGIVGTNLWNYKDANGKFVNQEIIAKLKKVDYGTGVWIEYMSRNAPKLTYAEKVVDANGKNYFIACGYYPDADRDRAVELVRRAYKYMKSHGKTEAINAFTHTKEFRFGDLYIVAYDLKGICIANGLNASVVGENFYDAQDEDGTYYVREMIKKAQEGGGWIDYKNKNAFRSVYVEKVDLGIDDFVVTCGLFPITKRETMIQLANSGADYLKTHEIAEACREFVKRGGKFIRGDLSLLVVDETGVCYADGDIYDLIWKNLLNTVDDTHKPFVRYMINTAQKGPDFVSANLFGSPYISYANPVQKGNKLFIVSSGFYL